MYLHIPNRLNTTKQTIEIYMLLHIPMYLLALHDFSPLLDSPLKPLRNFERLLKPQNEDNLSARATQDRFHRLWVAITWGPFHFWHLNAIIWHLKCRGLVLWNWPWVENKRIKWKQGFLNNSQVIPNYSYTSFGTKTGSRTLSLCCHKEFASFRAFLT